MREALDGDDLEARSGDGHNRAAGKEDTCTNREPWPWGDYPHQQGTLAMGRLSPPTGNPGHGATIPTNKEPRHTCQPNPTEQPRTP
ncbi:hypothetical protein GCM10028793_63300 [Nocardiopsis oceani]